MDSKIVRALQQLGLSDERISSFATIVDGVKERVRSEGLVYRKAKPAAKAAKPKPRTLRVSYAGPQPGNASYSGRAAATLAAITRPRVTVTPVPQARPSLAERARALAHPTTRTEARGADVDAEIAILERRLERRSLPDWQRGVIEQRLQVLTLLGTTPAQAAAATAGRIEGSQRKWQAHPRRGLRT